MFYKYEQRMSELTRIKGIPYEGVKMHALRHFITQEQALLNQMTPPANRSQALDSANQALQKLENLSVVNLNAARSLFQ